MTRQDLEKKIEKVANELFMLEESGDTQLIELKEKKEEWIELVEKLEKFEEIEEEVEKMSSDELLEFIK